MLGICVALLLVTEGIKASSYDNPCTICESPDVPLEFPETNADLQRICKPTIEWLECSIRHVRRIEECWFEDPGSLNDAEDGLLLGYRILATVKEICSEESFLHTVIVENLMCVKKLIADDKKKCTIQGESIDRLEQYAETLTEEGLVSLAHYENETYKLYQCIELMNFFACHSLHLERECGNAAMNAYIEILQEVGPGVLVGCEDSYDLLPAVIRLYKLEEEKQRSLSEAFRVRK